MRTDFYYFNSFVEHRVKRDYYCWLYDGQMVSPWLSGGFNAICRWIYDNKPDIADQCVLVKSVFNPFE